VELIFVETLKNKVFCIVRNIAPTLIGERHFLLANVLVNFFDVFAVKWSFAAK
jgi:hypothetical protein